MSNAESAFVASVQEAVNSLVRPALLDADKAYAVEQRELIKELFNESVTKFYNDYQPHGRNKRKGNTSSKTGGLYDLLALDDPTDGGLFESFEDDYMDLYDKANMHSARKGASGESLFETVFIEGYHGGAKGIAPGKEEMWGRHPNPGIPYYRTYGYVKAYRRRYKYGKWGRAAFKSESAYKQMITKMDAVLPEMQKRFDEIEDEYFDGAVDVFMTDSLPAILDKLGW